MESHVLDFLKPSSLRHGCIESLTGYEVVAPPAVTTSYCQGKGCAPPQRDETLYFPVYFMEGENSMRTMEVF